MEKSAHTSTAITMVRVGTGRTGRAIVTTNVRALLLKEKEGRCASTAVVSGKTTASTTFVVRRTKPTDEKNETALAAARPPLFPQDYRLDVLCISNLYRTGTLSGRTVLPGTFLCLILYGRPQQIKDDTCTVPVRTLLCVLFHVSYNTTIQGEQFSLHVINKIYKLKSRENSSPCM